MRPRLDASCASATCPPLSWYAPNRYTIVPGQPACRQIMNGVAATDSISTPRAFWCARKLAVPLALMAQTPRPARPRPRRHRGAAGRAAIPASSVTGHTLIAAPAPISAPRTPPRPVTHRAATDSATGTTSNLADDDRAEQRHAAHPVPGPGQGPAAPGPRPQHEGDGQVTGDGQEHEVVHVAAWQAAGQPEDQGRARRILPHRVGHRERAVGETACVPLLVQAHVTDPARDGGVQVKTRPRREPYHPEHGRRDALPPGHQLLVPPSPDTGPALPTASVC